MLAHSKHIQFNIQDSREQRGKHARISGMAAIRLFLSASLSLLTLLLLCEWMIHFSSTCPSLLHCPLEDMGLHRATPDHQGFLPFLEPESSDHTSAHVAFRRKWWLTSKDRLTACPVPASWSISQRSASGSTHLPNHGCRYAAPSSQCPGVGRSPNS